MDYIVSSLDVCRKTPEELLSGILDDDILSRFERIIEAEAPIREALLFKRAINSYGLEKVGSRLLELFTRIEARISFPHTDECGEKVFHRKDCEENYFRPTPDAEIRYSYQIPYKEAGNAVVYILEKAGRSLYRKEIAELFLKEMGWERQGAKVRELLDGALKDERIHKTSNGRYFMNNN